MRVSCRLTFFMFSACAALLVQMGDNRIQAQKPELSYAELPLSFEMNQGQAEAPVKFLSRTSGATVLLTSNEMVLSLSKPAAAVRMQLVEANPDTAISGLDELPGKSNYLIGSDPEKWRTNVSTFGKVRYEDVYPGVDLIYYGNHRQLEYDFVVNPGADPEIIRFSLSGTDDLELDSRGDLVLHLAGGDVRQHKPIVYQEVDGIRHELSGGYVLNDSREVSFQIAAYDRHQQLIIDPVVSYATYFGGSGLDIPLGGIGVDSNGNAYITGATTSTDFPRTAPLQSSLGGGDGYFFGAPLDIFVTKINAGGSAVLYSTYLGGSGDDKVSGISVDAAGNAYVTGSTTSTNFPVTAGVFKTTFVPNRSPEKMTDTETTVTKINPTGSALVYSTYLGGGGDDDPDDIAVDSAGNAYVVGHTNSSNFPTTAGAYQPSFGPNAQLPMGSSLPPIGDSFVTKLNATGSALVYSTFLGGHEEDEIQGIVVDATGIAYVAGYTASANFPTTAGAYQTSLSGNQDAFVTKLNAAGSALMYSTYVGGNNLDTAAGIAIDDSGNAYVAGATTSTTFPATAGAVQSTFGGGTATCGFLVALCGDAFVTKLNTTGTGLVYSTYLGGSKGDFASRIRVTSGGAAYIVGSTLSSNFPTKDPIQAANAGATGICTECADAFVTNLDSSGALFYSTYYGGTSTTQTSTSGGDDRGWGIAIDAAGTAYVTGIAQSNSFPTVNPIQPARSAESDAFFLKITGGTIGGGSTGGGSAAERSFSISNRGGSSLRTNGVGDLVQGYTRIQPGAGSTTPSGVAIFGYRQNNVLVSESGVPASPLIQVGRIYAEVGSDARLNTGIAVANPNATDALISFTITNTAGEVVRSGNFTLQANKQRAAFLDADPFFGPRPVQGTMSFTSNVPISMVALRTFTNERSDFLMSTLPVVDTSLPASTGTQYIPHFAEGAGLTTHILLVNPSDTAMTGNVQFFDQGLGSATQGAPTNVSISGVVNSTHAYSVAARSSARLSTAGTATTLTQGSVRVIPAGGGASPVPLVVFTYKPGAFTLSEAGVGAVQGTAFRLYVEASGTAATAGNIESGFAIANTSATPGTVTLELTNLDGTTTGLPVATTVTIPGSGQIVGFLTSFFTGLPNPFRGILRISTSTSGISVVGIRSRYNENVSYLMTTTPPTNEAAATSTAEMLFPHIVNGGGFTTEFIVFSGIAGQSSTGNLRFVKNDGTALTLTLN